MICLFAYACPAVGGCDTLSLIGEKVHMDDSLVSAYETVCLTYTCIALTEIEQMK